MKYPVADLFLVCIGPRCNGEAREACAGDTIRASLKDHNAASGRKKSARVCGVSCLDMCNFGPNMIAARSGNFYAHLTPASAARAYDGEMGDAPLASDLLLTEEEFARMGRGQKG
jgi:(2Fe-2S) ferredoxin